MNEHQWPVGEETVTITINGIPMEYLGVVLTILSLLVLGLIFFFIRKKKN